MEPRKQRLNVTPFYNQFPYPGKPGLRPVSGDFRSLPCVTWIGRLFNLTGAAPYAGIYFFDTEQVGNFGKGIIAEGGGVGFLNITFANNLSLAPDALANVFLSSGV